MLQKWKKEGKRFHPVDKKGEEEETTELSVKIRAAKFRDLPQVRICMRRRRPDGITWKHALRATGTAHTMSASSQMAHF